MSSADTQVLLVGGTSEIGLAIVRRLVSDGPVSPYLIGRDEAALSVALAGLQNAGATGGDVAVADAVDLAAHGPVINAAFEHRGRFDVVVLAVGRLEAPADLQSDFDAALRVMQANFLGAGSLLLHTVRRLREQGSGTLIVLSSVAAERPRASAAVYGASKAGLDALAQGLGDLCAGSGVRVLVVRPGFVHTRMTAALKAAPMATTADAVAEATVRGLSGRAHTVWAPARLRYVFAVLRHLPRSLFRRLPL